VEHRSKRGKRGTTDRRPICSEPPDVGGRHELRRDKQDELGGRDTGRARTTEAHSAGGARRSGWFFFNGPWMAATAHLAASSSRSRCAGRHLVSTFFSGVGSPASRSGAFPHGLTTRDASLVLSGRRSAIGVELLDSGFQNRVTSDGGANPRRTDASVTLQRGSSRCRTAGRESTNGRGLPPATARVGPSTCGPRCRCTSRGIGGGAHSICRTVQSPRAAR